MTIRPYLLNGMIQRTDDVSILKHQEDHKPIVDQQNIQTQVQKEQQQINQSVTNPQETEWSEQKFDAREEGKGIYQKREGKKNGKKDASAQTDKVIRKDHMVSFDMKV